MEFNKDKNLFWYLLFTKNYLYLEQMRAYE